jgi:CRISPR-associated endoribonuclease Cas6
MNNHGTQYSKCLLFCVEPLRFSFVAREPIQFPAGKSANILRGAFGTIFRRIACLPHCVSAATCPERMTCPYAQLFEPSANTAEGRGPSGLADHPRPFVFRAVHLDAQAFSVGQPFHFDLNLFLTDSNATAYLILTFAQLAREGLGPERRKVELVSVCKRDERDRPGSVVYQDGMIQGRSNVTPLSLNLLPGKNEQAISRLVVKFVTPTELKVGQHLAPRPEFGVLATRIRDRVSTLRELYDSTGAGPLPIDFREFGERAGRVRMTRCEIRSVDVERRSSRTSQTHSIGGFVGEAEYEGDLTEFVPYLRVATWTGVGRQTVWGKGEIDLRS